MNHVRTLISSSHHELQLVATALLWKLEKESETVDKAIHEQPSSIFLSIKPKKQYDIMKSYSHSHKEPSHRILYGL